MSVCVCVCVKECVFNREGLRSNYAKILHVVVATAVTWTMELLKLLQKSNCNIFTQKLK